VPERPLAVQAVVEGVEYSPVEPVLQSTAVSQLLQQLLGELLLREGIGVLAVQLGLKVLHDLQGQDLEVTVLGVVDVLVSHLDDFQDLARRGEDLLAEVLGHPPPHKWLRKDVLSQCQQELFDRFAVCPERNKVLGSPQ
jgi:hypothetical protein